MLGRLWQESPVQRRMAQDILLAQWYVKQTYLGDGYQENGVLYGINFVLLVYTSCENSRTPLVKIGGLVDR